MGQEINMPLVPSTLQAKGSNSPPPINPNGVCSTTFGQRR